MKNKSINEVIDDILNPSVSETIEGYSSYNDRRKHQTILSYLCGYVLKSIRDLSLNPHIILKDDLGNIVFNDSIDIWRQGSVFVSETQKAHIRLDFIFDGKDFEEMVCKISFFQGDDFRVKMVLCNYGIPAPAIHGEILADIVELIVLDLFIEDDLVVNGSEGIVTVKAFMHHYKPDERKWGVLSILNEPVLSMKMPQ